MPCAHKTLQVLKPPEPRIRCLHCHLTLDRNDLADGCCPECIEVSGRRREAFEEVNAGQTSAPQYRCDECGILIEQG